MSVAVNTDLLTSWFSPGVAGLLARHRLLLEILVDDQDHTHDALKSGEVAGCVTTLAQAMRGCVAEPLAIMRYRCMAAPSLIAGWNGPGSGTTDCGAGGGDMAGAAAACGAGTSGAAASIAAYWGVPPLYSALMVSTASRSATGSQSCWRPARPASLIS